MSNSKSPFNLSLWIQDVSETDEVIISLRDILSIDNDFIENEEHFRPDTLELGYKDEASRIVYEVIRQVENVYTAEGYILACENLFEYISSQEYFQPCSLAYEKINQTKVAIAIAYGSE